MCLPCNNSSRAVTRSYLIYVLRRRCSNTPNEDSGCDTDAAKNTARKYFLLSYSLLINATFPNAHCSCPWQTYVPSSIHLAAIQCFHRTSGLILNSVSHTPTSPHDPLVVLSWENGIWSDASVIWSESSGLSTCLVFTRLKLGAVFLPSSSCASTLMYISARPSNRLPQITSAEAQRQAGMKMRGSPFNFSDIVYSVEVSLLACSNCGLGFEVRSLI